MKMLEKLYGEAARLQGRLDEIDAAAAEREGEASVFTEEEATEYSSLVDKLAEVGKQIKLAEKREQAMIDDWRQRRGSAGVQVDDDGGDQDRTRFEVVEPKHGPFKTFGEQLVAIVNSSRPGAVVDERLLKVGAASGASSGVGADGGFLIQKDFSVTLLMKARESSVLWQRARRVPIGEMSDGLEAPIIDETSRATGSRWGGVQVYRVAEAGTVTATKPKLDKFQLDLEDMMGLFYATDRLLRDGSAMGAIVEDAFQSEFAFTVDDEIFRGNGVGRCLGFTQSAAYVSVAKESAQAAATVVAANVAKMYARMPARLKAGAEWFINSEIMPQLMTMSIANQPIFVPPSGFRDAPGGVLLGRPVNELEQCEALGTVGDIVFANMNEYVTIEKDGIQSDQSIHVRFINNERTFRWVLALNGQPGWKSSITPYKGSGTKSPFIGLATRA